MSSTQLTDDSRSSIELELYFLIARFLSAGPCQRTVQALREELREHKLLSKRVDWEGKEHFRSYENLLEINRHTRSDHLLKLCERLGPLLDKEFQPSVCGVRSLLGAGRQSVLRTVEDVETSRWKLPHHLVTRHGKPMLPPQNLLHPPNVATIVYARTQIGQARYDHAVPWKTFSHINRQFRSLGHLSAVYCIAFDRLGNHIITGADDNLLKVWSVVTGRLLATLRGHSAEITDLAINHENTLLATGSCDKVVRVWSLASIAPVAVLQAHTGMITSVQFCPLVRGNSRLLLSTGGDGCVCFWKWHTDTNKFDSKPVKFIERSKAGAQMLCSSFSPGGVFLATGSSDHVVRVYSLLPAPEKISELEAHMDHVDSIQYSHKSCRFFTGSRDGTGRIWRFERQAWKNIVLHMGQRMDETPLVEEIQNFKYSVTMVSWSCDDQYVFTAVNDHTLKMWDSHSGQLVNILDGHKSEVFVLEANPVDSRILLSAGHDGYIIIWDIVSASQIKSFFNVIPGQGHGAVYDCKWAPDGLSFAATDSHGFIGYYGFGSPDRFKKLPEEMFFHTDYRPLMRDANNFVLDEQTQQPPHLMPPPFLVDMDGNPHLPQFQRLVPGRRNCMDGQLVPQVGLTPSGDREVLDEDLGDFPERRDAADGDLPIIDRMIERLQDEQDQRIARQGGEPLLSPRGEPLLSPRREGPLSPSPRTHRRNTGDEAGVRQVSNICSLPQSLSDLKAYRNRVVVQPQQEVVLHQDEEIRQFLAEEEVKKYGIERKRKPLPPSGNESSDSGSFIKTRRYKRSHTYVPSSMTLEETGVNRLTTRALYDTEEEEVDTPMDDMDVETLSEQLELDASDHMWHSSSSNSESSDYSDWAADGGMNLAPPKRQSSRPSKRTRRYSSSLESGDSDQYDEHQEPASPSKRKAPSRHIKKKKQIKREKQNQRMLQHQDQVTELPEQFRPPEWLTDTLPRRAPYFPQMGDEVVYFYQGHQMYVNAVNVRNVYKINPEKNQPWHKNVLKSIELSKVIGIKYEILPPRLVCLKLRSIDSDSGKTFSIKYHDMADVIDFIVLRQQFDAAMKRKWKVGMRFRSLIDDAWWIGKVESREPLEETLPDSPFQCFNVHWDNDEKEKMSPWDFENVNSKTSQQSVGSGLCVTAEELQGLQYKPKSTEWPPGGRDVECDRITQGFDKIMELSIAEHFLAPVDLNAFPVYAMVIQYPIDLTTIKTRLENRFYRRVNAIQYDIRNIENNAKIFNEPYSQIVKYAKLLTELCLRFISDTSCYDPMPLYSELTKDVDFAIGFQGKEEDSDSENSGAEGTSRGKRSSRNLTRSRSTTDPNAWKKQCRDVVNILLETEDSEPFRVPVDVISYPEYYEMIDKPMDLDTVQQNLATGVYDSPHDLCKDMRVIFSNSKMYNTNKRSRIYSMTLRTQILFEEHFKQIQEDWRQASKFRKSGRLHAAKVKKDVSRGKNRNRDHRSSAAAGAASASSQWRSPSLPSVAAAAGPSRATSHRMWSGGDNSYVSPEASSSYHRNTRSQKGGDRNRSNRIESEEDEDVDVEEDEKEEADNSDSDTEYELNLPRSRRQHQSKKSSHSNDTKNSRNKSKSSRKLVNGSRYTTRCATGTLKRKRYDRGENSAHESHSNTSETGDSESGVESGPSARSLVRQSARGSMAPLKKAKVSQFQQSSEEQNSEDNASTESDTPKISSRKKLPVEDPASRSESESSAAESHSENNSSETEDYSPDTEAPMSEQRPSRIRGESSRASACRRSSQRNAVRRSIGDDSPVVVKKKSSKGTYTTRNQGRRTVHYQEDSEHEGIAANSDSETDLVSVSSRGRIRRHTPHARAVFS